MKKSEIIPSVSNATHVPALQNDVVVGIPSIAEEIGVSPATLSRMIAAGKAPEMHKQYNGYWTATVSALREWAHVNR